MAALRCTALHCTAGVHTVPQSYKQSSPAGARVASATAAASSTAVIVLRRCPRRSSPVW